MTGMNLLGRTPVEADRDAADPVIAPFDRRVVAVGAVFCAVLLALSTRYGFHRDELYFIECARHLQASYVDQPVLTPLLAWVSLKLFGVSLLALRLWPALAAGTTVTSASSPPARPRDRWLSLTHRSTTPKVPRQRRPRG